MTRRHALASLALPLFATPDNPPALIKPKVLRPGDTVGLITPATAVTDPDAIAKAERTAKFFGLKPRFARNVRKRSGYLGGSITERIADIHEMFSDPEIRGVFCMRGGYGAGQLLDKIDYDVIRRNPKIFVGYSDITTLHLAIHKRTGLVTFHGPVMSSAFTPYTQEHYRKALFSTDALGTLTNPNESNALRPSHILRTVRPGKARGRLIGGNLSLVAATMGTPFEVDTRGCILFIEDVDEQPYSVDRMLTQLRLAGKFDQAAGLVFGECADCRPREYKPSFDSTLSLGEVIDSILGDLRIPVFYGLTIGHTDDQLTLPEGVQATLDADKGTLTIEEPAVIS